MSREYVTEYQALPCSVGGGGEEGEEDVEEGQHAPLVVGNLRLEQNRSPWNHIEDLDEFFIQCYQYYQRNGFLTMLVEDALQLFQFTFVVLFGAFLLTCVDYSFLFTDDTLFDHLIYPVYEWADRIHWFMAVCLFVAALVFSFRFVQFLSNLFKYWRIRTFYVSAMRISSTDMSNMTWHMVQRRLLDVQRELHMCIHKAELSELDIYHRMLRFKNYMVALVNKDVLPIKFNTACFGERTFLSSAYKYNLEMILFWGPGSPFQNNWELKAEYKSIHKRKELADRLTWRFRLAGVLNLLLCFVIFIWQILYTSFRFGEVMRREPAVMGSRMWSPYSRLVLRHFNELDHEFQARLNRAYRPAEKYMNSFTTPLLTLVAKHLSFIAGALLFVLLLLTLIDKDMLHESHALASITLLGLVFQGSRSLIPDENMVYMPELLMRTILMHIHYMPDTWKGRANTHYVRAEFAQLFMYKFVFVLSELLSPLVVPLVLVFVLPSHSLDIVDFLRNYTVEVTGVGDVCSFAQMDLRRHGHPEWAAPQDLDSYEEEEEGEGLEGRPSHPHPAQHGKTELSLLHFTMTNPEWRLPSTENAFINTFKSQLQRDTSTMSGMPADNPLMTSSNSVSAMMGHGTAPAFDSIGQPPYSIQSMAPPQSFLLPPSACNNAPSHPGGGLNPPNISLMRGGGMRHLDLPISSHVAGGASMMSPPFSTPPEVLAMSGGGGRVGGECDEGLLELLTAEMGFNALYLHDHHVARRRAAAACVGLRGGTNLGAAYGGANVGFTSGVGAGYNVAALRNAEDERARRLWASTNSPSTAAGGATGTVESDTPLLAEFSRSQESFSSAAGSINEGAGQGGAAAGGRMANIEEGSEEDEVLNSHGGGARGGGRGTGGARPTPNGEKDYLLTKKGQGNPRV